MLNTSTEDYYYQAFNFAGAYLMAFDPLEYPDIKLGNTRNEIIDPNTENFIRVSIIGNDADPEVENYDLSKVTLVTPRVKVSRDYPLILF